MCDRTFDNSIAGAHRECGDKRIQGAYREKTLEHLASEHSEGASRIAHVVPQPVASYRVGDSRHGDSQLRILPVCAEANHHIRVFQTLQQYGQIGGIILPITIEREKDGAARRMQSIPQGGCLPEITWVAQNSA